MAQTILNIRMDEDLKQTFDHVCNELGMNMTTAITIFAKKMSREKRIPFDVALDPFYSNVNMERLKKAATEVEAGKTTVHELVKIDDD